MIQEEIIQRELVDKFKFLENQIKIQRVRRIFAEVDIAYFNEVFVFSVQTLDFKILCAITGLDEINRFGIIYHLANENGIVLSLKIFIPKDKPLISSITKYFSSAEIYEREIVDLFGINVEGLPQGKRYPLPDNWPQGQYPLRKDWKKEGVKQDG